MGLVFERRRWSIMSGLNVCLVIAFEEKRRLRKDFFSTTSADSFILK